MASTIALSHRIVHHSSTSTCPVPVGELQLLDPYSGDCLASSRRIYVGHDLIIGRDMKKCQWILDDPQLSAKHLRIYTIVYENEEDEETENLVYAEDVSRNGTFWNDSLIGKGNGGFLLSHNDKLRLSAKTLCRFLVSGAPPTRDYFDLQQEREMTHFRQEYVVTDRLLGAGAFGKVFMAIEQHTRTQVACKIIDLRKLSHTLSKHFAGPKEPVAANKLDQDTQTKKIHLWAEQHRKNSELEQRLKNHYREVEILSQLSHPNIIGLDKVYVSDNTLYLFQDLVTAGDLFSYLESKNGRLLEVEAAVIIRQILIALEFLHDQDIVHRDLKPENIMMTSLSTGCRVVLTDFGHARHLKPTQRTVSMIGSEPYTAPEVKKTAMVPKSVKIGYTRAVDLWSVGAISVVLLTGNSAFSNPTTGVYSQVLALKCDLNPLLNSKEWQRIRPRPQDFITRLLIKDEHKRLTARQALQHEWFSNEGHKTDFEELYQRTIRNWYPRAAKSSVVEFIESSFVRHLVSSAELTKSQKHHRSDKRAVNPPYKPFPRNMHMLLWPKRKQNSQVMSIEVETAITKNWTGNFKKNIPQFTTNQPNELTATTIGTLSVRRSLQMQKQTVENSVHQSQAIPAPLPIRVHPPSSTHEETLTIIGMPRCGQDTKTSHLAYSDPINKNVHHLNSDLQLQWVQGSSYSLDVSHDRGPKLSTQGAKPDDAKKPSKRWRDYMYNIPIPTKDSYGDMESGDPNQRNTKRQKMVLTNKTKPESEQTDFVAAHNDRIALEIDYDGIE